MEKQIAVPKESNQIAPNEQALPSPPKHNIFLLNLILILIFIVIGIYIGKNRGIPFVRTVAQYSIGIYTGDSPINLVEGDIKNPVISAKDVSDIDARFVADPFLINSNDEWFLFFEVLNNKNNQGDIGLAKSKDGKKFVYDKIILDEEFHLSFPVVFKFKNEFYMIPESHQNYVVNLYKAENFPYNWKIVKSLVKGDISDPMILHYNNMWWLFGSDRDDMLHLYYSKDLFGEFLPHPSNPIIYMDSSKARLGGRIIVNNNVIYRYAQDCKGDYGLSVNVFRIIELTENSYKEIPLLNSPIVKGTGKGWNSDRMHHVDAHQLPDGSWIAAVDGVRRSVFFGVQY